MTNRHQFRGETITIDWHAVFNKLREEHNYRDGHVTLRVRVESDVQGCPEEGGPYTDQRIVIQLAPAPPQQIERGVLGDPMADILISSLLNSIHETISRGDYVGARRLVEESEIDPDLKAGFLENIKDARESAINIGIPEDRQPEVSGSSTTAGSSAHQTNPPSIDDLLGGEAPQGPVAGFDFLNLGIDGEVGHKTDPQIVSAEEEDGNETDRFRHPLPRSH